MQRQVNPHQGWKKWKHKFYHYFAPTYLKKLMLEKQEVMINVVQFSQIYILHHHFGKKR